MDSKRISAQVDLGSYGHGIILLHQPRSTCAFLSFSWPPLSSTFTLNLRTGPMPCDLHASFSVTLTRNLVYIVIAAISLAVAHGAVLIASARPRFPSCNVVPSSHSSSSLAAHKPSPAIHPPLHLDTDTWLFFVQAVSRVFRRQSP